jgi:ankyrin repeat protein
MLTALCRSTALIVAAMKGHTLIVEQLIAAGAALDVQNSNG